MGCQYRLGGTMDFEMLGNILRETTDPFYVWICGRGGLELKWAPQDLIMRGTIDLGTQAIGKPKLLFQRHPEAEKLASSLRVVQGRREWEPPCWCLRGHGVFLGFRNLKLCTGWWGGEPVIPPPPVSVPTHSPTCPRSLQDDETSVLLLKE